MSYEDLRLKINEDEWKLNERKWKLKKLWDCKWKGIPYTDIKKSIESSPERRFNFSNSKKKPLIIYTDCKIETWKDKTWTYWNSDF